MPYEAIIPLFNILGAIGFLTAIGIGIQNYLETDVEKPFWLAFTFTASLGAVWLTLVTVEWLGFSSVTMNTFSTSLQSVIIGVYAIAVIGTDTIVEDLKQSRRETAQRASIVSILSRVLRHNLRNDLTVIRGYTAMFDDSDEAEIIKSVVDDLLALSEKARELDRIAAGEFERKPTDVVALIEEIVEQVSHEHPSAVISVENDQKITAAVLPSFTRVVKELIENAAKHAGDNPTINVSVTRSPKDVEIRIADDGPGLDDQEIEVLNTGKETPLSHGSGIGLWLVHWIVTSHDGSIDTTVTEKGTTMTVSIPRTPSTDVPQQLSRITQVRDQYRAAFEEANDAMVIINDEGRIVDANNAAGSIYGLGRQELLGRPILTFLPDDFDFEAAWNELEDAELERDTVSIMATDREKRSVEYAVTTDIVPGQHLVVSRNVIDSGGR